MTDRSRSPRRLILIGAVLLAATAIALVLGVVPPLRSDTSDQATPGSASAAVLLGMGSFFLMFLLGEGLESSATGRAAEYGGGLVPAVILAVILAVALFVEPNRAAALQAPGVAIVSSAGSSGGLALAARTRRAPAVPAAPDRRRDTLP